METKTSPFSDNPEDRITIPDDYIVSTGNDPDKRIVYIRWIVKNHQYLVIDGIMLDAFTAQGILAVHDALKPEYQEKYRMLSLERMAESMWKLSK